MYLGCPPKFCINIFFKLFCDDCITYEQLKAKVLQNYGGEGGKQGIREMSKWKNGRKSSTVEVIE